MTSILDGGADLARPPTVGAEAAPPSQATNIAGESSKSSSEKCQNCEFYLQKYVKLRQKEHDQRTRRKQWIEEQRELVQRWEQAHCDREQMANLRAELLSVQEKLQQARRERDAQSTRVVELELLLKRSEARCADLQHQLPKKEDPVSSTSLGSVADVIHEFEQSQSFIAQYIRQKDNSVDPYEECDREKIQSLHAHDRRDSFTTCTGECNVYVEQLTAEIDGLQKEVHFNQHLLHQQHEHHAAVIKAVNEKYRDLKTSFQLAQQRITSLVYQLHFLIRTRPVMLGPRLVPPLVDPHAQQCDHLLYAPTVHPQHNFT